MCPIWPLHLIILYLLALCPLWVLCNKLPALTLDALFDPATLTVHMDYDAYVRFNLTGSQLQPGDEISVMSIDPHIATTSMNSSYKLTNEDVDKGLYEGTLRVYGNFLGHTNIHVEAKRSDEVTRASGSLPVTVLRPERLIDTIFVTSVAVFVSLIFINFGCAMHWPTVKEVMRKPIGPAIGMVGQFLFMPLMSFGLGYLIFPDSAELHLGMFFTGVAPGGGASNIWTFILGGNLNLSLAMTTISTLASLAFMPMWLFSLGQVVFANANIVVPYVRIVTFVLGLIIPLGIGLAMQKYTPRLAAVMVRILKVFSTSVLLFIIIFAIVTNLYIFELFSWRYTPKLAAVMVRILKVFSTSVLLFIIIFAIVTNLYIFELFSWRIVLAGMGIPWLGYLFGYFFAWICKRPHEDALAISIETGIQNTGIAIFLLRYALEQPAADITTVIPVASAIMTPVPMTAIFIYQKIKGCVVNRRNEHKKIIEEAPTPVYEEPQPGVVATIDVDGK